MTTTEQTLTYERTLPIVKVKLSKVKHLIREYFALQGKEIVGMTVNYQNHLARNPDKRFANRGEPVTYLRFKHAVFTDGQPVTEQDLEPAIKHVLEDAEMKGVSVEFVEGVPNLKIGTRSFFPEGTLRQRPSVAAKNQDD